MKQIAWTRVRKAYNNFIEGKGFVLIITVCVAVITASAVWTGSRNEPYIPPAPPAYEEQEASVQMQQTIQEASTPTPLPPVRTITWHAPLSSPEVVMSFSADQPIYFESLGIWATHTGSDLQTDLGEPVYAMADGKIISCGEDPLLGVYVHIRHAEGYESRCSGLKMLSSVRDGDQIRAGQTLGFAGNTIPAEDFLGPHLHLEILHHGEAIDPAQFLR